MLDEVWACLRHAGTAHRGPYEEIDVAHQAAASSSITDAFSLAADKPGVRRHRKTRIGHADGIVTNNELTTILSD
jgi:fermentation-respiration switch protein FrsA (DUF1100 family)